MSFEALLNTLAELAATVGLRILYALAVLFAKNGETLMYQLARGKGVKHSVRELIQAVNAAVGGKGGGRDDFAQGSAPVGGASDVDGTVEQIKNYCRAVLKG